MRIILLVALLLSGCGNIPSFYDDNESLLAVNVRYELKAVLLASVAVLMELV
jgi:uncharacterized protein YceK